MFLIYQFLLLLILLLLISSYIKKNISILIFSFISSLFLTIQITAIAIKQELFNADFINYLNLQSTLNSISNILLFLLVSIVFSYFFFTVSVKINKLNLHKQIIVPIIMITLILLNLTNGVFYNLSHIWKDPSNNKPVDLNKTISLDIYTKDTSRFIAHAGGEIDGYMYTDSLEALNNSYKNGFKMFELDILKTSDNIYVAAHDWKMWAQRSRYKGILPPDSKVFLENKPYNKFTPLDINRINQWFKNHPDAILITDKVNTPLDFSKHFIDKSRLIMELFTWKAVKEGLDVGIKSVMPTFELVEQIKGNKIDFLLKNKITRLTASRDILKTHKNFLINLKNVGIHTFAFINKNKNIDEIYFVCNEGLYFYGLYADNWDFNSNTQYCKGERK